MTDVLWVIWLVGAVVTWFIASLDTLRDPGKHESPMMTILLVAPFVGIIWPLVAAILAVVHGDRLIFRLRGVRLD